jgi:2-dehydro-3-deoxyglucarate aldolase/4-hydroxy-2-oxoheptanedioate aldolase
MQLINKLKQKIKNHEKTIGTLISMSDPIVTEITGQAGYDFLWLDTEHGPIDYYNLEVLLMACTAAGVDAMVRVPWNDAVMVKRVLDLGPQAVLFPLIKTYDEAVYAMKSCLYPPEGHRGCAPGRAFRWGTVPLSEYCGQSKDLIARVIQIEHVDTVKNLKEIVKIPEIDAYMFGPLDLSGSVGELPDYRGEKTRALMMDAVKILRDNGKYYGAYTTVYGLEELAYWRDFELPMVCSGSDWASLMRANKELYSNLKQFQSQYVIKKPK